MAEKEYNFDKIQPLLDLMKNTDKAINRKVFVAAARAGARVIAKDVIRNARRIDDKETALSIEKNVSVQFAGRAAKYGDVFMRVGILGGANSKKERKKRKYKRNGSYTEKTINYAEGKGGDTFYWRFVEFGTKRSRAKPFMIPAMNSSKSKVMNAFVKTATDRFIKLTPEQD